MANEMTMLFAGDISTHRGKEELCGAFARELMAQLRKCTAQADVSIANFENPVAPDGAAAPIVKSGPCLCGLPENIDVVKAGGFDCVSLANNHFGDYGEVAMAATFDSLRRSGIMYLGAGENLDAAYKAARFEKNGVKVSVIAACENEFGAAGPACMGTACLHMGRMYRRIQEEKQTSQYVIVFFHGGNEDNPFPAPLVAERYRLFVDYGADAVIGGHTHCMQGTELYKGKPIVYSMGNLYFRAAEPTKAGDPWNYGYMVFLQLHRSGEIAMERIPYRQEPDKIRLLCGAEKKQVLAYLEEITQPIPDAAQMQSLFEGWSLVTGPFYASLLEQGYTEEPLDDARREATAHVLNNFQCEAHWELLMTTFRLQYEGRLSDAQIWRERLERYRTIPV